MAETATATALTKPKSEHSENLVADLYFGIAEKTFAESSYVPDSLLKPYNPDDLYQKTGDYRLYEEMLDDDQVSVCLQLKKDLVIGSGWDIFPEEDGQDEIVEDIKVALCEDASVPFDDSLEEILSAYEFGFSLTEKIFKNRPDGSLTLNALKTRHPATWIIHTDVHGNVERYEQRGPYSSIDVEPRSLIHYVLNRKFQNPYGKSDLRPAYAAWFTKRQIIRYYAIFLEKAASPTPIAKYNTNAPPQAVTDIYNAIRKFQAKTALAIPKDIEVEFLEAKSNGEVYEKALNIFNMFIGRSLFIPDLLGFHGSQTGSGSLALGKEQINIFVKHIMRRRKALEDIVNNEIIWPIVFYNHGYVDNYPKFKLRPINDADAIEGARIWIEAVKGRLYKASDEEINHFRSIVKFPEGEVDREAPPAQLMPNQSPGEEDDKSKAGQDVTDDVKKETENKEKEPAESEAKQFKLGAFPRGDYHKKCDFKAIQKQLEAYDDSIARDAKPLVQFMIDDMLEQIAKKKVIQSGDAGRLDSVRLKRKNELKLMLKRSLRDIYNEGKKTASSELFKNVYALPQPESEFLELLEKELFNFIGDWEYQLTKQARQEVIAAIKDGRPLSSVVSLAGEQLYDDALVSIERYARTKHTEVLNKGRLAFFEDSGVVTAYQYSAILDDSTSDICRGLDGKIFKSGTQPVPPMHFNCRSLLIPITKFEEYEVDTRVGSKPIDDFIEENKGKGFPTQ